VKANPRGVLLNLAALVLGIVLAIAIAEGALRLTRGGEVARNELREMPFVTFEGTYPPWSLEPGSTGRHIDQYGEFDTEFRISSLGFRDEEMPRERPEGTFRILLLGDSMTVGWGVDVEETFSSKLELLLNETAGGTSGEGRLTRYQTLNCGWASWYAPDGAYVFLKHRLEELAGDLVVLNVFLNDPTDLEPDWWRPPAPSLPDSLVEPPSDDPAVGQRSPMAVRVRYFLDQHSHVYSTVRRRLMGVTRKLSQGEDLINMEAVLRNEYPANAVVLFTEEYPPFVQRRMELMELLLVGMRDLCAEKDVRFAVSVVPAGFQVLDSKRESYCIAPVIFDDQKYVAAKAQAEITSMCDRNDIPVLDLLPPFQDRASVDHYFVRDPHMTPKGHDLIAEEMARFLRDRGLLDKS
jgi:lysophospholipase L1-like esterase